VLTRIVVGEDETAQVGSELAVIDGDGGGGGEGGGGGAAQDQAAAENEGQRRDEPQTEEPQQDTQPQAESAPEPAAQESPDGGGGSGDGGSGGGGATTVVRMPALGESVTEGTVTRWLKQVGDSVDADEPLLEVSTDKVDTEIPSPAAGTLLEIKVGEDDTVAVGAELAVIGGGEGGGGDGAGGAPAQAPAEAPESGESPATPAPEDEAPQASAEAPAREEQPAPARAEQQSTPARAEQQPAPARQEAPAQRVDGEEVAGYVTPLVRKLAAEQNVDLSSITGTGVGGRIRRQDVLEAAERAKAAAAQKQPAAAEAPARQPAAAPAKAQPSPLRGRTEKMSRMRAVIARRMVESLQVSAQLTTVVEVDVTKVARLRDRAKADFQATHGVKLSFLPFFALTAVEALRVHPSLNASIDMEAGTVTYHDVEHLGMAVDSERGLVVPVIHSAGDLNLAGLAKRIADVAERTRTNKISPDELSGGTFTVTNTGSRGALFDTPIINQPQVGILGTGAVVKRAAVVNDPDLGEVIAPRSMVFLALSYDHRLVDGADAARFLTTVKERLEAGNFESELGLA
jgi:2-oxoglutarate dehydrogenase E2 component (dihydrolipoamide succinyltransferase)